MGGRCVVAIVAELELNYYDNDAYRKNCGELLTIRFLWKKKEGVSHECVSAGTYLYGGTGTFRGEVIVALLARELQTSGRLWTPREATEYLFVFVNI
jgi:hypothetical protein